MCDDSRTPIARPSRTCANSHKSFSFISVTWIPQMLEMLDLCPHCVMEPAGKWDRSNAMRLAQPLRADMDVGVWIPALWQLWARFKVSMGVRRGPSVTAGLRSRSAGGWSGCQELWIYASSCKVTQRYFSKHWLNVSRAEEPARFQIVITVYLGDHPVWVL